MIAQVQREGKLLARGGRIDVHAPRRVADAEKSREPPAFGLECVDGKGFVAAATRMHHMIPKTTCRSLHPAVAYIESQRQKNTDWRVQRRPWLAGAVAHSTDEFARATRWPHRHSPAVASHPIPIGRQAARLDLEALQRGIDITRRAAGRALLAHHMPRFKRLPQFEQRTSHREVAELGEAKFEVRREPVETHAEAGLILLLDDVRKILENEMRQQKSVMQLGSPTRQVRRGIGLAPETRHQ